MSRSQTSGELLERYSEASRKDNRLRRKKMAKAIALYGSVSLVLHVLLLMLISYLNWTSNIVEFQIEWDKDRFSGIGMVVDPMKGEQDQAGAALVKDEKKPDDPVAEIETVPKDAPETAEVPEDPDGEANENASDPKNALNDPSAQKAGPDTEKTFSKRLSGALGKLPKLRLSTEPADTNEPVATAVDGTGTFPGEHLPGLEAFGPGNARIIFLFRTDRVRGSRFEKPFMELMKAFPDYKIVVQNSGLDPVHDFDAMVVASNNLNDASQTFTAIRHHKSDAEIKKLFNDHFIVPLKWEERQGRPYAKPEGGHGGISSRDLYMPAPGLAVIMRPSLFGMMHAAPAQAPAEPGGALSERQQTLGRTLIETLMSVEQVDGVKERNHAVFLAIKRLRLSAVHRRLPKLPMITGGTASISAGEDPDMLFRFDFATEEDAKMFVDRWPAFAGTLPSLYPFVPGLGDIKKNFTFNHKGGPVAYGEGHLPSWMVDLLLASAVAQIESITSHLNR